ncbi:MAG: AhpC/TSA family protein [Candidatus Cloacimonetes bacterium]|nr:AhpC/TSA family protein [Candidatus Cloacimonadota bacterium]
MIQNIIKLHLLFALFLFNAQASQQVFSEDSTKITPVLLGHQTSNLTAVDENNVNIDISKLTSKKPTVLVFYRGGWCPYCNRHLGELQKVNKEVDKLGFQIIAVSPDQPSVAKKHNAENKHKYLTLSDSNLNLAKQFGIVFKVNDALFTKYKNQYGIDLEANSGQKHHLLPVPSVFLIDTDGKIKFSYVNVDYKVRLNSTVLLSAIESLAK